LVWWDWITEMASNSPDLDLEQNQETAPEQEPSELTSGKIDYMLEHS
jgi:hypothetical protein